MPLKHFSSQAHASTLSPPPAIRIIPTAPNSLTLSHQKNTLQQTASRPHLITTADFELSNIELAEFTDAFSLFDYHGSGHISKKEARIAMRSLGFDTTKQEFDLVMGNVGVKSDESSISLAQFIQVMRYHKAEQQAKLQMASLFQTVLALGGSSRSSSSESLQHTQSTSIRFSNSRMGISAIKNERDIQHILKQKLHASNTEPSKMEINTGITGDHLKRIAALVGEPLSNEDVRDMMEEADKSNCGLVTEQDFIKLMRKTLMINKNQSDTSTLTKTRILSKTLNKLYKTDMSNKDKNAKDASSGSRGSMSIIGDAILAETIKKELRHFKLNEKYTQSPSSVKNLVFTNKPTDKMLYRDMTDQQEKETYNRLHDAFPLHDVSDIPKTTSSIYGWDTRPLVRITDRRFHHPKTVTEITKMYETCVVAGGKSKPFGKTGATNGVNA